MTTNVVGFKLAAVFRNTVNKFVLHHIHTNGTLMEESLEGTIAGELVNLWFSSNEGLVLFVRSLGQSLIGFPLRETFYKPIKGSHHYKNGLEFVETPKYVSIYYYFLFIPF